MRQDWNPLSERYDARSGLWLTKHERETGGCFFIARPRQTTVFACAAGATEREAVANWQRRVAPTYQQRTAA